ncbi:MAG TPA: DNA polymerase III subunit gamma/tau [Desulfomonilaceae bacterium]|nr:DNA polymerase III subunit gamma/tau [Desulfomonilaceae bacterium]
MPSYLVLARKYRPSAFSEVVGQEHVVRTLTNSIVSGRVAHAFLFCGVRGVGKTTVARILAKALNCSERQPGEAAACNKCTSCKEISAGISVDVQEIDGASNTSVDNVREINENIKYPPVSSPYKIIIIDEVHMISINAFNALLKTLEEPPPHAKFIFATTEPQKVPATINSRCQRFNFKIISMQDIINGMSRILEQEGIETEQEALALIAREAQGSFRDALSLLDQVIGFNPRAVTAAEVMAILGITAADSLARLMTAVLAGDSAGSLALVQGLLQQGYDPDQFVLDLLRYVRNLLVMRTVPQNARAEGMIDAPASELQEMESLAGQASAEDFHNLLSILLRAEGEIKRSGNPWVGLEMTVLKMASAPKIVELSEIIRLMDSSIGSAPKELPDKMMGNAVVVETKTASSRKKAPSPSEPIKEGKAAQKEKDRERSKPLPTRKVTSVRNETPDELWSIIKERISSRAHDQALSSIMDHGKLIVVGPTEVEIGFTKAIYKEQFESGLATKSEAKAIFQEFFGDARLRILTLARETSLATENPYSAPNDGQTDLDRALKNEAQENPITRAVLEEFEGSSIEEVRVISPKT